MAKQTHAAATEVTVAPLAERTGFEKFVHTYWKHGVAVFVVIAAVVMVMEYTRQQDEVQATQQWTEFGRAVVSGGAVSMNLFGTALPAGSVEELDELASETKKDTAAWALLAAAARLERELEFEGALERLDRLEREHPQHLTTTMTMQVGEQSGTLAGLMRERISAFRSLKAELPAFAGNPDPPADAPRVTLKTTAGSITLALYPGRAPQHTENFLELCRSGQYVGTKFHRVIEGFMIQGGDRTSIDGPKDEWGTGDPGYTIPQEFSDLTHFEGYLAAAKREEQEESGGNQFYITLGPAHHLDRVHTVFGKVVEGMDIVRAIGAGEVEAGTTDRPVNPIAVTETTVAE